MMAAPGKSRIAACALVALMAGYAMPVFAQAMPGQEMPDQNTADQGNAQHGSHHQTAAGQGASTSAADMQDMKGMKGMSGAAQAGPGTAIPQGPPPPAALSGPAYAADTVYPPSQMAGARAALAHEMGGMGSTMIMLDRLEATTGLNGPSATGYAWEAEMRTGSDIDRLWITTEGDGAFSGGLDSGEVQAFWSHAIGPWFDAQAGLRQTFGQGPERTQLALGVEGLAPYMFEVQAHAYLSTHGEVTARIEGNHDMRLTQRLILQPRAELNWSAQDMPALRTGAGFTTLEAGARLRYELRREFAPYIGVSWHKSFGRTAAYMRADGDDADQLVGLVGIRAWF